MNDSPEENKKIKKRICSLIKITQWSNWDSAFQGVQNGNFRTALELTDFLMEHITSYKPSYFNLLLSSVTTCGPDQ